MMEQQEIICLGVANRAVDKGVQGVLWGRAPPLSNGKKAPPYLKSNGKKGPPI